MDRVVKWAIGGDRQNAERGFVGALVLGVMYAASFLAVALATFITAVAAYGTYGTVDRGVVAVMIVAGVTGLLCAPVSAYVVYDVRSKPRWSLCTFILSEAAHDE